MTFPRVLIAMTALILVAVLHEAGARYDFLRLPPIVQTKTTTTVNGVPVHQALSGELTSAQELFRQRLAPLAVAPTASRVLYPSSPPLTSGLVPPSPDGTTQPSPTPQDPSTQRAQLATR
jgi:hypothetical protein